MPDTGNAKDYLELAPTNYPIFTLKSVNWRTYLINFTVQYFLDRACFSLFLLLIKFNMPDTGNAKDYLELPPTTLSIFTLKSLSWRTYLIIFTVQYCFLFRFVCIELVSLIRFLQIWVAIYVYGTMCNWSTLIKKLMQTSIVKVFGSILNISTVHFNGIWHLIWRYLSKSIETLAYAAGGAAIQTREWGRRVWISLD